MGLTVSLSSVDIVDVCATSKRILLMPEDHFLEATYKGLCEEDSLEQTWFSQSDSLNPNAPPGLFLIRLSADA